MKLIKYLLNNNTKKNNMLLFFHCVSFIMANFDDNFLLLHLKDVKTSHPHILQGEVNFFSPLNY